MSASCSPPDALERVSPAAWARLLANCRVPGRPSPAQVPPVTLAGSEPLMRTQYSGSFPFTPAGQEARLTVLLPGLTQFLRRAHRPVVFSCVLDRPSEPDFERRQRLKPDHRNAQQPESERPERLWSLRSPSSARLSYRAVVDITVLRTTKRTEGRLVILPPGGA